MPMIDQLNERFAIPKLAKFRAGQNDLPLLSITAPQAMVHIYLHGAHVAHYHPEGNQPPVLYLSPESAFEAGKPIRGGVPIIFPWFGPRESDPKAMHGLVRTRTWDVREVKQVGNDVIAVFGFDSTPQTRATWDHDFALTFTVTVGDALSMELATKNTGSAEFTFADALHTYFAVRGVEASYIRGLTGTTYIDKIRNAQRFIEDQNPLVLTGPTDRVYLDTTATCTIDDPGHSRRIVVDKEGSNSTVVWNPWSDKVASLGDVPVDHWPKFLCVETCNVWDNQIRLGPGATHVTKARIRSEAL